MNVDDTAKNNKTIERKMCLDELSVSSEDPAEKNNNCNNPEKK